MEPNILFKLKKKGRIHETIFLEGGLTYGSRVGCICSRQHISTDVGLEWIAGREHGVTRDYILAIGRSPAAFADAYRLAWPAQTYGLVLQNANRAFLCHSF